MRTHYHFIHLPHHHNRLSLLYLVATLRTFIFGFFSLFLPILVFQHFLIVGEKGALIITIIFFLLHALFHLLTITLTVKIASKYGLKTTFFLGQLILLLLFILLIRQDYFWGAVVFGLASSLWWFSYHYCFIELSTHKRLGKEVGTVQALGIIATIVAPLVGGLFLNLGNELSFYGAGIVLIVISLIFILFFKQVEKINSVSFEDIKNEAKKMPRDFIAFIGGGAEEIIYTVAWPLMLFYVLKNLLVLAEFSTLVLFLAALAYYVTGIFLDHINKEKLEKIGILSVSTSWLGKAIFQTPLTLSIFDTLHKVLSSFFVLPLMVIAYDHADKNRQRYIAFREVGWKLGNIAALIIFSLIVLFNLPFWLIFFAAALFSTLPAQIKR